MSSPLDSFDISDLSQEAHTRWLKPPEVLFILQNYEKYKLTNEPPQTPSNGSLFLFNKRTLRNFRKDGHNWRKKRDNRSIKEAHERLKVGSDEALNCYYAHGESNPSFQRRSYWMLDSAFKDIVLVHYRDTSEGKSPGSMEASPPSMTQQSPVSSSSSEVNQALRKIKEQLSLDEDSISQLNALCTQEERDEDSKFSENELAEDTWLLTQMLEGYNTPPALDEYISDHFINKHDFVPGEGPGFDSTIDFRSNSLFQSPPKFTIRDMVPNWGFSSDSTKLVIVGSFLSDPSGYEWTCKIGDYEVPVEAIQDGVLRCEAPPHPSGKVAVSISANGKSCSETREFEYREKSPKPEARKSPDELLLLIRWVHMLLSDYQDDVNPVPNDETWNQITDSVLFGSVTPSVTTDWIMEQLLKSQLNRWISSKRQETNEQDGCILTRKDQGIIHNIAGLGFDWALRSVLQCGISIDFRDISGWTALHWAARFGREEMVAALVASGASALAVTDPNASYPVGQTPASVADYYGHKGLAGYLSELSLTSHLSSLQLSPSTTEIRTVTPANETSNEEQAYIKDTLAAVRNAAQAAARIQAAFRSYSFRKMKDAEAANATRYMDEYGFRLSEGERRKIAALSIQKKYRGWKGRREFLTMKKKVVKLQAHVRGYQARKNFRVCWAVGILEKAILRWRRKGVGLRGYRADTELVEVADDEDILKLFRLQKVNRAVDEAVSRVLSLVESAEARQQYHRMLLRFWQARAELGASAGAGMDVPVVFQGTDGV